MFYYDVDQEEAELYATRLRPQAQKVVIEGGEDAYSGWKDVPVW